MSQWQLPAVVAGFLAWMNAPAATLGELGMKEVIRRQLVPAATHSLVTERLPTTVPSPVYVPVVTTPPDEGPPPVAEERKAAVAAAGTATAGDAGAKKDEAWWRDRMTQARQALERDRFLVEAVQGRINSLTTEFVNRDDPAQRAVIEANRLKAIAELDRLKKQIEAGVKAIEDIKLEARREGVPPGWIR